LVVFYLFAKKSAQKTLPLNLIKSTFKVISLWDSVLAVCGD